MAEVSVRYVGNKPIKRDTVTGSLAVWMGKNSVCDVPNDVAMKLFQFPEVWAPADVPVLERPVETQPPSGDEGEEESGEPVTEAPDTEVRPEDEHGFEIPPPPGGAVTVDEVVEALPLLDQETDFTETGKPAIASVRRLFPERELSVATVGAAWRKFTGE